MYTGVASPFQCPNDTAWNPAINNCDWETAFEPCVPGSPSVDTTTPATPPTEPPTTNATTTLTDSPTTNATIPPTTPTTTNATTTPTDPPTTPTTPVPKGQLEFCYSQIKNFCLQCCFHINVIIFYIFYLQLIWVTNLQEILSSAL